MQLIALLWITRLENAAVWLLSAGTILHQCHTNPGICSHKTAEKERKNSLEQGRRTVMLGLRPRLRVVKLVNTARSVAGKGH